MHISPKNKGHWCKNRKEDQTDGSVEARMPWSGPTSSQHPEDTKAGPIIHDKEDRYKADLNHVPSIVDPTLYSNVGFRPPRLHYWLTHLGSSSIVSQGWPCYAPNPGPGHDDHFKPQFDAWSVKRQTTIVWLNYFRLPKTCPKLHKIIIFLKHPKTLKITKC